MESGHQEHHHGYSTGHETFEGHFWPGLGCLIMGILWTHNALFRYHVARRQAVLRGSINKNLNYKNFFFSVYHSGRAQAFPVEAFTFCLVGTVSFIGECIGLFMDEPVTVAVQHMLIFSFFAMVGATSVLQHYKFMMPPSLEYVAYIFANGISVFLLVSHSMGRSPASQKMHAILLYTNVLIILCTAIELINKRNVTAGLGRPLISMVQGMWLWILAVILHPYSFMHSWDQSNHALLKAIPSLAIVTIAVAFIIAFFLNFVVSKQVKNMKLATVDRIVALTYNRFVSSGGKGEAASPLISDSDCEA